MRISDKDFLDLINSLIASPFIIKTLNSKDSDELLIAQQIYDATAMLNSSKRELNDSLKLLKEISHDAEYYQKILQEYVSKETEEQQNILNTSEESLESLPKVDKEFIKRKNTEINTLRKKKQFVKSSLKKECEETIDKCIRQRSTVNKWALIPAIVAIIVSLIAGKYKLFSFTPPMLLPCFILGVPLGGVIIALSLLYSEEYKILRNIPANPSRNKERITDYYSRHYARIIMQEEKEIDKEIKAVDADITRGYDVKSSFKANIFQEQKKYQTLSTKAKERLAELRQISKMSEDGFQHGVLVVEKTIENFESINMWASNVVHDYIQSEHNRNLEEIEDQKRIDQKRVADAKEKAMMQRNELLKSQVESAQRLAEAEEQQARAIRQQAEATKEIQRRMENERFGDYYKYKNESDY